jgi:hypothetical protein
MDRQTLRDWVHRYNEAGIVGLASRKPPGAVARLTQAQMAELRALVIAGPDPKIHKVVRWRCVDLRAEARRRPTISESGGTPLYVMAWTAPYRMHTSLITAIDRWCGGVPGRLSSVSRFRMNCHSRA